MGYSKLTKMKGKERGYIALTTGEKTSLRLEKTALRLEKPLSVSKKPLSVSGKPIALARPVPEILEGRK